MMRIDMYPQKKFVGVVHLGLLQGDKDIYIYICVYIYIYKHNKPMHGTFFFLQNIRLFMIDLSSQTSQPKRNRSFDLRFAPPFQDFLQMIKYIFSCILLKLKILGHSITTPDHSFPYPIALVRSKDDPNKFRHGLDPNA